MERSEIEAVLKVQQDYFSTGATLPVAARKDALRKLRHALETCEKLLTDALEQEIGRAHV